MDKPEALQWQELAAKQWLDKTYWVQQTAEENELGMHRADVLRQRIERLKAERAELLAALNNIEVSTHDAMTAALARAAIAKAEEQK
jgi:hypothetical protein